MLTNEIVLRVFSDYLAADDACEVLHTRHGYAVLEWETEKQEWNNVLHCETPEDLRDALLNMYRSYRACLMVESNDDGELSDDELSLIENECRVLVSKCV